MFLFFLFFLIFAISFCEYRLYFGGRLCNFVLFMVFIDSLIGFLRYCCLLYYLVVILFHFLARFRYFSCFCFIFGYLMRCSIVNCIDPFVLCYVIFFFFYFCAFVFLFFFILVNFYFFYII